MKYVIAILLLAGLQCCTDRPDHTAAAAQPQTKLLEQPPITSQGRWFRDATGRVIILQGTFTVSKPESPAPDGLAVTFPAYGEWLAELGMNVARLAYHWSALEPQPGTYDAAYLQRVRIAVDKLAAAGVFVLLDSHQDLFGPKYGSRGNGFPDWAAQDFGVPKISDLGFPANYFQPAVSLAFDNLWLNTNGVLDAYTAQLGHMAATFADEPYVLGYDLMNEPWPGSQYPTCFNLPGCPQFDQLFLQPAMDAFAAAVRAQDPDAIAFYEPQFTFDSGAKTWLTAPPDAVRPAGFSFHDLCVARAVRQAIDDEGFGTLLEQACDPFHTQVYVNAFEASIRMDVTPFMTEVLASNERDTAGLECLLERAEDNKMSWTVGQYPSPNNNNLPALARVFPRAIAGIPDSYRFDPRTGIFTFRYRPDAEITAPTLIGVPVAVHYPAGYDVEVNGGRVLSEPNAVQLAIAHEPAAEWVEVRLQPVAGDALERPDFPSCYNAIDEVLDIYQQLTSGAVP